MANAQLADFQQDSGNDPVLDTAIRVDDIRTLMMNAARAALSPLGPGSRERDLLYDLRFSASDQPAGSHAYGD